MKNRKFEIGNWVEVKALVDFEYNDQDQRVAARKECSTFTAQVVGAKIKFLGKYNIEEVTNTPPAEDAEFTITPSSTRVPRLTVTGSRVVWAVKRGMLNKELLALEEDLVLIDTPSQKLPWQFNGQVKWSAEKKAMFADYLKRLSEEMKTMPREVNGRFHKITKEEQVANVVKTILDYNAVISDKENKRQAVVSMLNEARNKFGADTVAEIKLEAAKKIMVNVDGVNDQQLVENISLNLNI